MLPFLKIGTTAASFHKVGNFSFNKLVLKTCLKKRTEISEQHLVIKLGISSGPTLFDELTCRMAFLTSESEMGGTFKKADVKDWELFGITTEEGELRMVEN
jgi:hypothetical protein